MVVVLSAVVEVTAIDVVPRAVVDVRWVVGGDGVVTVVRGGAAVVGAAVVGAAVVGGIVVGQSTESGMDCLLAENWVSPE